MAASSGGIRIRVTPRPRSKTKQQSSDEKTRCCCAKLCHVSSMMYPSVAFYRFPKDHERCSQWLENAGLANLSPDEIRAEHVLCAHHFDKDQFVKDDSGSVDNVLKPDATPTEFGKGADAKTRTHPKRSAQPAKAERTKKKRRKEDPASPREAAPEPLRVSQRKNKGVQPDDHCYALDWDSGGEESDKDGEEGEADGETRDPDYSPEGIADIDRNLSVNKRCTVNLTRICTRNYERDSKTDSSKGSSEENNAGTKKPKSPKAKGVIGVKANDLKGSPKRSTPSKTQPSPRKKRDDGAKAVSQKRTVTQIRGQTIMLVPVLSQDQVGRQKQSKNGSSPLTTSGGIAKKRDIKVQYPVTQEVQNNYNRLYSELQMIRNRQKAYRSELLRERLKATRLKKRVATLEKRLSNRNLSQSRQDITAGAARFLAEPALSFFAHQLMRAEIKGRGMLWNDEVKTIALELYRRSPSAYQFCEEVFAMPSITRLNIWAKQKEAESQQGMTNAVEPGTAGLHVDKGDRTSDELSRQNSNDETSNLPDDVAEMKYIPEKEIVEQTVVVYLDGLVS